MLRVAACCCLGFVCLCFGFEVWVMIVFPAWGFMICDALCLWVFRGWFDCLMSWLASGDCMSFGFGLVVAAGFSFGWVDVCLGLGVVLLFI